jgi:signal recognition particle receptor subunit beta
MGNKVIVSTSEDETESFKKRVSRRMSRVFNIQQLNLNRRSTRHQHGPLTSNTMVATQMIPIKNPQHPAYHHMLQKKSQSDTMLLSSNQTMASSASNNIGFEDKRTSNSLKDDSELSLGRTRQREVVQAIKVLLLGAEESGKTTIYTQMDFIMNPHYSIEDDDLLSHIWAAQIITNIMTCLAKLSKACVDQGLTFHSQSNLLYAKLLMESVDNKAYSISPKQFYTNLMQESAIRLWEDETIKTQFEKAFLTERAQFERQYNYSIPDGIEWFLNDLKRITPNFVPSNEDAIHCRKKTTGFWQKDWRTNGVKLMLVDVGGNRKERVKYANTVEDLLGIDVLVFVVSASDYDQVCTEDHKVNRMEESLDYFEEYTNNPLFADDVPVFILLNKTDVLQKKLSAGISPQWHFKDYDQELANDLDATCEFIKDKFVARMGGNKDRVQVLQTCAVDKESITNTMNTISEHLAKRHFLLPQ